MLSTVDNIYCLRYKAPMGENALVSRGEMRVRIGSTVTVALELGKISTFTITTPKETDPSRGAVSYESPIGKALLDRKEGEVFSYVAGNRAFRGKVLEIQK